MTLILDPSNETQPISRQLAARAATISGSVALLDIAKPRGDILINEISRLMAEQLPDITLNRYQKPTFTKPAPEALRQEIRTNNDYVIEALAD